MSPSSCPCSSAVLASHPGKCSTQILWKLKKEAPLGTRKATTKSRCPRSGLWATKSKSTWSAGEPSVAFCPGTSLGPWRESADLLFLALSSFLSSLRIYPHDQDTGGFFVAVIQKAGQPEPEKKAAPSVAQETLAQSESNVAAQPSAAQPPTDTMANQPAVDPSVSDERPAKRVKVDESAEEVKASKKPQKKEKKEPKAIGLPFKEEPFFYLSPENEEVKACM